MPDALYKAGSVYVELGEVSKAQGLFQRVVTGHPRLSEAMGAAENLNQLRARR